MKRTFVRVNIIYALVNKGGKNIEQFKYRTANGFL